MNLKQLLVGSRLGNFTASARERIRLIGGALKNPATMGMAANDYLAGLLVTTLCKSDEVFIDVGAHIGSVIAAVKDHDAGIEIIAVEATPEKAEALQRKFPDVVVHACAVGTEDGHATFFVDTRRPGFNSLKSPQADNESIREIQVRIRKIDDLIASDKKIGVIKMDIEGGELNALRGAVELLSKHHPLVMFESGPAADGKTAEKSDLYRFFQNLDYVILLPNRLAHNDDGLSHDGFLEGHLYPRYTTNYFAVHKSRRTEYRDRARRILQINTK